MVKIVDGVIQQNISEQSAPGREFTFYASLVGFPIVVYIFGVQAGIVAAIVVGGLYLCNSPSQDIQNTLEVSCHFYIFVLNYSTIDM